MKQLFIILFLFINTITVTAMQVDVIESAELNIINQQIKAQEKNNTTPMTESEKSKLLAIEKAAKKDQFPFESDLTPGVVETKPFATKAPYLPNIFVISDDANSIAWLKNQKETLKEKHAIGFITNVASRTRLEAIEQQTGWAPLLPASMDGIESVLQVSHTPFMVIDKVISQ